MDTAAKIKAAREDSGLTQAQLAERVNLHARSITDIEIGRRTPSLEVVHAIAVALGISPHTLDSRLERVAD